MRDDFKQGVEFSHNIFKDHIEKGAVVVDATTGNGKDTVFLAKLVGNKGFIWGFDIQLEAVKKTKEKIQKNNINNTKIIWDTHEKMDNYIEQKVDGIIFNLGYLPQGDKEIITTPETTLTALKTGLNLLKSKGIIVIVGYPGHEGGKEEINSIIEFCRDLKYKKYNVLHYHFLNQETPPAEVIAIKYRSSK